MQTSTIRKFHGEPTNREENVTHARRNHSHNGRIRPITVSRRYQDLRGLDRANRDRRRVTFHGVNDSGLVLLTFTLCIFGLMMLFSTSSYNAALQYGDSTYFLRHQAGSVVAGLFLMVGLSRFPDYHLLAHFAIPGYLGSLALILMVIPFGYSSHGAKRWIKIAGMSVQPAEVAKVAMILFLAALICKMRKRICKGRGFWFFLATPLLPCALIYKVTQNLSSAAIIFGITVVMLFVATPDYGRFILFAVVAGALIFAAIYYITRIADPSSSFRFARVLAWLHPEDYAREKHGSYQTLQSLYAIGSGGIFGKGPGESMQKTLLPEAQNDMIFSIICEEMGIFGGIALVLLFLMLLWRMMVIANNAPDLFGSLLVVGVMAHIAIQVILNIAVVTNTIPNTGITLPFISFGGSAVLVQLAEVGIVMNVARRIEYQR